MPVEHARVVERACGIGGRVAFAEQKAQFVFFSGCEEDRDRESFQFYDWNVGVNAVGSDIEGRDSSSRPLYVILQ